MTTPLNGLDVRDAILNQGKTVSESTAFFLGNITKGVQDSNKGALTIDSGRRIKAGTFKVSKDLARNDTMCAGLCCVSIGFKAVLGVLVWCPVPYKLTALSVLKATSVGYQRLRDLCAADPSSPLC